MQGGAVSLCRSTADVSRRDFGGVGGRRLRQLVHPAGDHPGDGFREEFRPGVTKLPGAPVASTE